MSIASSQVPGEWMVVDASVRRRILAHTPEMMVVEVEFATGGYGPEHCHPHLQATYVRSGRFRFTVAGVARTVAAGDSLLIASNAPHSCESLEGGTLIDVFTPAREDFLPA